MFFGKLTLTPKKFQDYDALFLAFEVEKFMVDGKHFSHSHPLRLCEDNEEDIDDDNENGYNNCCCICGLAILSTPSYTCTIACKFFIHQQCALKIPTILRHHSHIGPTLIDSHKLFIQKSSPSFIYECEDCDFKIHPLLAVVPRVEIKTKHRSHQSHQLVAICREMSSVCDACGVKQDGFFFSCQECNVFVHRDCTLLPDCIVLRRHPHPFILAYSLPPSQTEDDCIICQKPLPLRHHGVYFCPLNKSFAHVSCGMDECESKTRRLEVMKLPHDEWGVFPSLMIRRYASDLQAKLTIQEYHKHPLIILNNSHDHPDKKAADCHLCTSPITINNSPFYRCSQINNCDFAAHTICADILPILNFFIPPLEDYKASLCPNMSERFFNSVFLCYFCRLPCNGLCYYFPLFSSGNGVHIDLQCMVAPSIIRHASHDAQHILYRTSRHHGTATTIPTCCHRDCNLHDVYRCILCEYYIHIGCAMLPKRIIRREYDEHPLHLFFPATTPVSCCFCEVCEEDIDVTYWLYRCVQCDKSFHVNCIRDAGYLSKVRFGGTLSLPHECHPHDVTLTRMLTLPSQRCGYCSKTIKGCVDEMAFFCSLCHFWIHFSCARDSSPSKPNLYWETDE